MKLDLVPAPNADLNNRRDWLVFQFYRYGKFHRRLIPLLFLVNIGIFIACTYALGNWGILLAFILWFATDYAYDRVAFALLFNYHQQIATYVFDGKDLAGDAQNMNVFLNDLENFIYNNDGKIEERLRLRLKDSFEEFKKRRAANGTPTEVKEQKAA